MPIYGLFQSFAKFHPKFYHLFLILFKYLNDDFMMLNDAFITFFPLCFYKLVLFHNSAQKVLFQ